MFSGFWDWRKDADRLPLRAWATVEVFPFAIGGRRYIVDIHWCLYYPGTLAYSAYDCNGRMPRGLRGDETPASVAKYAANLVNSFSGD